VGMKKPHPSKRKLSRLHYGADEWQRVTQTFETEIEPIVKAIKSPRLAGRLKESLQNYLIIRLVSMTDYYFSNIVRRLVDEQKLDAFKVMDKKSLEEEVNRGRYTAGQIVATTFNYANYEHIQTILSGLLDIDFMETVRELDRTDPYKYAKGAISLDNNWEEFRKMFDLRDDIPHEMKDARLSKRRVFSLADNTINFLEAASWICHPEFRNYENNRIIRQRLL
jgi:hypothetical protein